MRKMLNVQDMLDMSYRWIMPMFLHQICFDSRVVVYFAPVVIVLIESVV